MCPWIFLSIFLCKGFMESEDVMKKKPGQSAAGSTSNFPSKNWFKKKRSWNYGDGNFQENTIFLVINVSGEFT